MTVQINNQTFTYQELRDKYNLPEDVIIEGCHTYSNNIQDVEFLKTVEGIRSFPVFGFGESLSKLLAEDETLTNNIYKIFDNEYLTIGKLIELGFGPTQAENYYNGLKETYKNGIPFNLIIKSLNIPGCGETISEQYTRYFYNKRFSKFGLTQEVWETLMTKSSKINNIVDELNSYGYEVIYPYLEDTKGGIKVVLTGSPKSFGYKTKKEFLESHPNLVEIKRMQDADYLITDNLNSTSSKMKLANKYNVEIIEYYKKD